MGVCSVFECNSNTRLKTPNTSFHKFPKGNINLSEQWVSFCKRKDNVNIHTARICCLHFQNDDFENNVKYDMGFTELRMLKPDAVPTIHLKEPSAQARSHVKGCARRMTLKKKRKKSLTCSYWKCPMSPCHKLKSNSTIWKTRAP